MVLAFKIERKREWERKRVRGGEENELSLCLRLGKDKCIYWKKKHLSFIQRLFKKFIIRAPFFPKTQINKKKKHNLYDT